MNARKLKRDATESAARRGHVLRRFWKIEPTRSEEIPPFANRGEWWRSECVHCWADVDVHTQPMPNEIDIGGEAIALNCGSNTALVASSADVLAALRDLRSGDV